MSGASDTREAGDGASVEVSNEARDGASDRISPLALPLVTADQSWDKCRIKILDVGKRGVEVISDSINNIIIPRDGLMTLDVLFHSKHHARASEGGVTLRMPLISLCLNIRKSPGESRGN